MCVCALIKNECECVREIEKKGRGVRGSLVLNCHRQREGGRLLVPKQRGVLVSDRQRDGGVDTKQRWGGGGGYLFPTGRETEGFTPSKDGVGYLGNQKQGANKCLLESAKMTWPLTPRQRLVTI